MSCTEAIKCLLQIVTLLVSKSVSQLVEKSAKYEILKNFITI